MSDQEDSTQDSLDEAIEEATDAVAVQTRELEELAGLEGTGEGLGLEGLMNVPVTVTLEVGRGRIPLSRLVGLGSGSLLELECEAHEPADVLVNGKIVARGEIVTIDDRYGIRITSVEH